MRFLPTSDDRGLNANLFHTQLSVQNTVTVQDYFKATTVKPALLILDVFSVIKNKSSM